MRTHKEIVKAAGTAETVAESCQVSVHTVRSWMLRNSIAASHWAAFANNGWATFEELAGARSERRAA
jgi:Na+/H+ antiporter NhaC